MLHQTIDTVIGWCNEPLGAKGPPLVREEVRKKDVGKVGSSYILIIHDNILLHNVRM